MILRFWKLLSICIGMALVFAPAYAAADSFITPLDCGYGTIEGLVQEGVNDVTGDTGCGTDISVSSGIGQIANHFVSVFSVIVGIVAVIMVIYAGFRYITSGGDNGRVGNAKNTLLYAIIGLVIVVLAQVIVRFVLNTANGVSVVG